MTSGLMAASSARAGFAAASGFSTITLTRASVDSSPPNAIVARKNVSTRMPTGGLPTTMRSPCKSSQCRWRSTPPGGSVSGKRRRARTSATSENSEAAKPGAPFHGTNREANPRIGPNVKPMPKAAPIRAMPRERLAGVVQSAMTAWAVEMVAPAMPAPMRAAMSSARPTAGADSPISEAMPKSA
jgi:hypothetical protein